MNGDDSSVFMKSVSAWISTVWPTILNFVAREAIARTESARAFLVFASAGFSLPPFCAATAFAADALSVATEVGGVLVCVTVRSQVYAGNAVEISSSRCGHR